MTDTFTAVFKTGIKYGSDEYLFTDQFETKQALETYLEKNGVKKPLGKFDTKGYSYYPISVTTMTEQYCNRKSKKFRVYFDNGYKGQKPFIQSNAEGVIDGAKLIAKATEAFEDYQQAGDNYRAKEKKLANNSELVKKLNIKLIKTPFKAETDYIYGFKITADCYYQADLEALVEKLLASFSK